MIASMLAMVLMALTPFQDRPEDPAALAEGAETDTAPDPDALERLYDELAAAEDAGAATVTATQIEALWASSGSATADLLTDRATQALGEGDADLAERHLDDAVRIAPDYAEGWVRRAELLSRRDAHGEAVASLERALAADPRHYRALLTLARTLEAMDRPDGAYEIYGEALKTHPYLEEAEEGQRKLAPLVEGRAL